MRDLYDVKALLRSINENALEGRAPHLSKDHAMRAHTSLMKQPLDSSAFQILGAYAQQSGDPAAAESAFIMADRLSRRDLQAQLWLIEHAVQSGNVREALVHYDAALSVYPRMGDALFPVLAAAIVDPAIRDALRPYVRRGASWTPSFLDFAVQQDDVRSVFALLQPISSKMRESGFSKLRLRLISSLAASGELQQAGQVVRWTNTSAVKAGSNISFTTETVNPDLALLGWTLGNTEAVSATLSNDGAIDVSVSPLRSVHVATRIVPVEGGGEYVFSYRSRVSAYPTASFRWKLSCIAKGERAPIWTQITLSSSSGTKSAFRVPSACTALKLELLAEGPDGQLPATASISNLSLTVRDRP